MQKYDKEQKDSTHVEQNSYSHRIIFQSFDFLCNKGDTTDRLRQCQ